MRPTISLKSRKLAPILTKCVIKYLLRAFSSLICRYYHAQVVPKSCHKLSCDAYSHWHNISIYLDVFCEINFAKITHFEVHKSCNTLHEILDLFLQRFLWMTICKNISLCQKFLSGMDRNTSMNSTNYSERPTISLNRENWRQF